MFASKAPSEYTEAKAEAARTLTGREVEAMDHNRLAEMVARRGITTVQAMLQALAPAAVPQLTASDVVAGDVIGSLVGDKRWKVQGPLAGGRVEVSDLADDARRYSFDAKQLAGCRLVASAREGIAPEDCIDVVGW